MPDRWASFDCYGTLVDWDAGIGAELARLFPRQRESDLLRRYHAIEPRIQAREPGLSYRAVMRATLHALASELGLEVPGGEDDALGASLPHWPVFPEVPAALHEAAARGWRLAILSNTDPDLIEASKRRIGVRFDETIAASEIASYKPARRHWDELFARTGADPARHVHVAASLFHDIGPANALGLTTVWINRKGEEPDPEPARELPDLAALPEVLDDLVPA